MPASGKANAAQLEGAGYVSLRKEIVSGRQRTRAALTAAGRRAFAAHVAALQALAGLVESERG